MNNLENFHKGVQLSIIITSHKNDAILKLCLDSVRKNIFENIKIEVIVVDVEETEAIRDLLRIEYPEYKYVPLKNNTGFARALNIGIKISQGDIILSLNPDIVVKENAIEKLYNYAVNNPNLGIAGPMLLNFNGSIQSSAFKFYTPMHIVYRRTILGKTFFGKKSLRNFSIKPDKDEPQKIDGWLMGSAMTLRRDNMEKVGLMDERYFMYLEDVDWSRRFYEAGYDIVFLPEAKMFHYHTQSSKSKNIFSLFFNKMTFAHFMSGIKYFLKFKGWKVKRKNESIKQETQEKREPGGENSGSVSRDKGL